jgi:sn-glycerol 3-phosphate transport system substrate-binding protein
MLNLSSSLLSRRSLLAAAGALGAGAALGACGAPGGASGGFKQADMNVPKEYEGRTNVLVWSPWTEAAHGAVVKMCNDFNKSQTDIYVGAESQVDYETLNQKLSAAIQAKATPDVVCFPEFQWLEFYFAGAFVELDPYFTDDWNLDIFIQNYVKEGVAAGKTYVVPFARSTPLFYFNRDVYAKAGLPEEGPKTWDDLAEYAPEIAKIKAGGRPMRSVAFGPKDGWYGQAHIWAWGGNNSREFEVTIDQEPGIEWLEWKRKFIHTDKYAYMAKESMTDFTSGLVAASHGSTASLTKATTTSKFDVGVAFMLGKQSDETKVPTGGSGLSVVKADSKDRQDAAVEFCKYLAKPEVCAFWHKATGYVPIVTAAKETQIVKDLVASNPNYGVALDQLKNAQTADRVNWFQAGVSDIQGAMAQVYGDNTPATEALGRIKPNLEKLLEENREDLEQVLASS